MKRFSDHKSYVGKAKVADLLSSHEWTPRPDLEKCGAEIKGTPYEDFSVSQNELGQIGVISDNGWSAAVHKDEASFIEHQHRIFANRHK